MGSAVVPEMSETHKIAAAPRLPGRLSANQPNAAGADWSRRFLGGSRGAPVAFAALVGRFVGRYQVNTTGAVGLGGARSASRAHE